MIEWRRRVFARFAPSPLVPLTTTTPELRATKKHHDATLAKADAVLRDFDKMDVAFRAVVRKP